MKVVSSDRRLQAPRHHPCPLSSSRIPGCLEALLRPQVSLTFMLQEEQTALEGKRKSVSAEEAREEQLLPRRCPTSTPAGQLPWPPAGPLVASVLTGPSLEYQLWSVLIPSRPGILKKNQEGQNYCGCNTK